MLLGMLLETFINENNKIRFKIFRLVDVLVILNKLHTEHLSVFVSTTTSAIEIGSLDADRFYAPDLDSVLEAVGKYKWAIPLAKKLKKKTKSA